MRGQERKRAICGKGWRLPKERTRKKGLQATILHKETHDWTKNYRYPDMTDAKKHVTSIISYNYFYLERA